MEIKRDRSEFWIKIHKNSDNYIILTNDLTKSVIDSHYNIKQLSPNGWKKKQGNSWHSLWLPFDGAIETNLRNFEQWAENICSNSIWLRLNKNIQPYFEEDVLDYCMAADWNYDMEQKEKTMLGEAESNLKYRENKDDEYFSLFLDIIKDRYSFLPHPKTKFIISTIPATQNNQQKLSYELAQAIANEFKNTFLCATLSEDKPEIKSLPIDKKVETWTNLYDNGNVKFSHDIKDECILIIDDLYQSGVSMWSYAKYLKKQGVKNVAGLVAVKSMRDDDNKG